MKRGSRIIGAVVSALLGISMLPGPQAASVPVDARALAFNCATCHSGAGKVNGIPSLAGRSAADLERRLLDFKYGRVPSTLMNRIAKAYADQELAAVAAYLAHHDKPTYQP
jgi:cytochrome c553